SAPSSVTNYSLTLPNAQGTTNQFLTLTDNAGTLDFTNLSLTGNVSNSGNNVTILSVGGSSASNVNSATILANNATSNNTANAIAGTYRLSMKIQYSVQSGNAPHAEFWVNATTYIYSPSSTYYGDDGVQLTNSRQMNWTQVIPDLSVNDIVSVALRTWVIGQS